MAVGKLAVEHALQIARATRGELEDPEVELVVADHVHVVAARRTTPLAALRCAGRPAPEGSSTLEVAQLAELERRQVLG